MTVDNSPYVPFFTLFLLMWSVCFCKWWRRSEEDCAARWGTEDAEERERKQLGGAAGAADGMVERLGDDERDDDAGL